MSLLGLMPHTCTVQRNLPDGVDGYNHPKTRWSPVYEELRCRYMPRTSNLRGIGGLIGEGSSLSYRDLVKNVALILVPADTYLSEADQIVNIKDQGGVVVEAGPLNIILEREAHNAATRHHRTLVVEKLT